MKTVCYARFSSTHQKEESITAQLRAIQEYAAKNRLLIIKEYNDEAKSATTDDRPQFLQMIRGTFSTQDITSDSTGVYTVGTSNISGDSWQAFVAKYDFSGNAVGFKELNSMEHLSHGVRIHIENKKTVFISLENRLFHTLLVAVAFFSFRNFFRFMDRTVGMLRRRIDRVQFNGFIPKVD